MTTLSTDPSIMQLLVGLLLKHAIKHPTTGTVQASGGHWWICRRGLCSFVDGNETLGSFELNRAELLHLARRFLRTTHVIETLLKKYLFLRCSYRSFVSKLRIFHAVRRWIIEMYEKSIDPPLRKRRKAPKTKTGCQTCRYVSHNDIHTWQIFQLTRNKRAADKM